MRYLTLLITSMILLAISSISVASLNYNFVAKRDTSYSNVRRGAIVISIPNNVVPNEQELKIISNDSWKKYSGKWNSGSVFVYVKHMPTNGAAYSVAEYKHDKLNKFYIQDFALQISEMTQSNNKSEQLFSGNQNNNGHLQIDSKYKISKKTPVMPDPDPNDKVESLKKVIYLQPSDIIQIAGQSTVNYNLWYEVFAYKNNGTFVGYGWINSLALLGQNLHKM